MNYDEVLQRIHAELRPVIGQGRVASYIPELAKVSPHHFGMAVVDGFIVLTRDEVWAVIDAMARVDAVCDAAGEGSDGGPAGGRTRASTRAAVPAPADGLGCACKEDGAASGVMGAARATP